MATLPTNLVIGSSNHVGHSNQAYEKLNDLNYDVKADFGAECDGTTDDTAAVNDAIAEANSRGGTDAANIVGTTIFVPNRCRIAGQLDPITKSGVTLRGSSKMGSVLLLEYNGPTIRFGDGTSNSIVGGSLQDLKVEYLSAPPANAAVVQFENASRIQVKNLDLVNVRTLATLGVSAARYAADITFENLRGYVYNGGSPTFSCVAGAGLHLKNCHLFVGGVGVPVINRTSTMDTVVGTNVFNLGTASWDLLTVDGCTFERYYRGVYAIAGNGVVLQNIFTNSTTWDYLRESNFWLETTGTGGIYTVEVNDSWLAAWEGNNIGCRAASAGAIRGVQIKGNVAAVAGTYGTYLDDTQDVILADNLMMGANRTDVSASQVVLLGASSDLHIHDNNLGQDSTWGGYAWQPFYGLAIDTGVTDFVIHDNNLAGTSAGLSNGATGTTQTVYANLGVSTDFLLGGDTNLYRGAANILKTDDKLATVAGLGVGNSAAGNTLGSVVKKIEVFDAAGTSLGFVPVYDAITQV